MAFQTRPREIEKLTDRKNLIPISDLFRSIPELQGVCVEYLGAAPLSFHMGHAQKNMVERDRLMRERMEKLGKFNLPSEIVKEQTSTFVAIYPDSPACTVEYVRSLNIPLSNLEEAQAIGSKTKHIVGELAHPAGDQWWRHIPLYKSSYCGTTYIVPVLGKISDPVALHLLLLYSLSIICRYMPDLWYDINVGKLNQLRSLIEHYLAVFDRVMPHKMLERVSDTDILMTTPGSLNAPV